MKIVFYPDKDKIDENGGPILRFFKDLQKKDPSLWVMVRETLIKVSESKTLLDLEKQGWVSQMSYSSSPIYEFKIPPKKRRQGVARLYFGYKKSDLNTIVILSAEKKHGRIKANRDTVKQAEKRYKEVCI